MLIGVQSQTINKKFEEQMNVVLVNRNVEILVKPNERTQDFLEPFIFFVSCDLPRAQR